MKKKSQKQEKDGEIPYTGHIPKRPMKFVWYMAKQYRVEGFMAFFFVTLAVLFGSSTPYILGRVVDSANKGDVESVFFMTAVFVAATAGAFISWRGSGYFGMKFILRVERKAHIELFAYLLHHSQSYFNNRFAGSLASKVSNGADGAEHMLDQMLWNYYGIFLNIVVSFIYIILVHPLLGLFFIGAVVGMFIINYILVRKLIPLVIVYNESTSRFRGGIIDVLTNIFAAKSYARLDAESRAIESLADNRLYANEKEWLYAEKILILNNVLVVCIMAVLFGGAAYLWSQNTISVGVLIMLVAVLQRILGDLTFIGNNMRGFIKQYGMIEEGLSEILVGQELTNSTHASELIVSEAKINFSNVTFKYGDNSVFENFNLTVEPGQRIGLVGQSGAGKSTFVSLLLRQYDLTQGAIIIDEQNIAQVTQNSLRDNIAVVPQEPMLFHRSIRENIAYGKPDATDAEITEVAKKAQAHDFISLLPQGYDTLVGERGVKLSGGQKQRVAIARAMLKNAPILILDEATSALDSENEVAIQEALHELMEGKTVIAIAHRLSTLREMDRIIVLEEGKIIEDGTHTSLTKKKGGVYERLWKHQAGGFLQE